MASFHEKRTGATTQPSITFIPMADDAPKPWEQQSGESSKAFSAFTFYRDMPPSARSLEAAYRAFKHHKNGVPLEAHVRADGRFRQWSTDNRWVARAQAWDREQDRITRDRAAEQEREAVEAMRKRHIGLAMGLQNAAANALQKKLEANGQLTESQIVRFMAEGTKLERLSRGEPDTIIGGDPIGKLAEMLGVHPAELREQMSK